MRATPCFVVSLAIALGIGLAYLDAVSPAAAAMGTCVAGCGALVAARRRQGGRVAMALVCVVMASAWRAHTCWPEPYFNLDAPALAAQRASAAPLMRVRLTGPPRSEAQAVGRRATLRVRASVLAMLVDGQWQPHSADVMLFLWAGMPVARGDVLLVPLHLRPAPTAHNLGDPSPARWTRRQGVSGRAQVMGAHIVEAYAPSATRRFDVWRQACVRRLEAVLRPPASALGCAMALGQAQGLSPALRQRWADAGMAHLLAVSGLHVALVMALVHKALRGLAWLWPRRDGLVEAEDVRFGVALGAGVLFAALCGDGWASMRAVWMAASLGLGQRLGQRPHSLQALGLAAAVLLWGWPGALMDLGFVLSFAAVLGLVLWAQPRATRPMRKPVFLHPLHAGAARARSYLGDAMRICTVAQLATAPICAWVFGQVAFASVPINVVAVPLASAVVVLGLVCAFVEPQLGGQHVAALLGPCLQGLDALARWAARVPGARLRLPAHSCVWQGGMLVLFVGVTLWRRGATRLARTCGLRLSCGALGWVVIATAAGWGAERGLASGLAFVSMPPLRVEQLYVGQGDAALVTFPAGLVMLIDGGGVIGDDAHDPGRRIIAPALVRRNIRRIDVMVLTHPHPDHLGGLLHIAERYPVGALWLNGDALLHADVQALIAHVERRGGRVGPPPPSWRAQGVDVTSYMPLCGTWASANDHSLVLRLQYGQRSIVLAGDIEARAEALLAQSIAPTDFVKVGHHGSRTSTSATLLEALKPWGAIISCGEDNQFGFPHKETLATLARLGIAVWRTDTMGALRLETDGEHWRGTGPDARAWTF